MSSDVDCSIVMILRFSCQRIWSLRVDRRGNSVKGVPVHYGRDGFHESRSENQSSAGKVGNPSRIRPGTSIVSRNVTMARSVYDDDVDTHRNGMMNMIDVNAMRRLRCVAAGGKTGFIVRSMISPQKRPA